MPRTLRNLVVLLAIVLVYLLIFPRPMGTELLIEQQWVVSLDEAARAQPGGSGGGAGGGERAEGNAAAEDESRLIPFRLGERFGYFTPGGELFSVSRVRYGLAQSATRYSNYSVISETIVLQHPDGSLMQSIPATGYPYLDDNRLFVFAPNGNGLSEWGADGRQKWSREFLPVITDLDAGPTRAAVGLLNGQVELLRPNGESEFSYETEGSRYAVTLAVALGSGEDVLAAVAGVDPQKLILFERHTEGFFPTLELDLETDYRRPVLLRFLRDGRTLVAERPEGFLAYDMSEQTFGRVDLGGSVREVAALSEYGLLVSAASVGAAGAPGVQRLQATVDPGRPLFRQSAASEDVFLEASGSRIYFGMDGRLACVELSDG